MRKIPPNSILRLKRILRSRLIARDGASIASCSIQRLAAGYRSASLVATIPGSDTWNFHFPVHVYVRTV